MSMYFSIHENIITSISFEFLLFKDMLVCEVKERRECIQVFQSHIWVEGWMKIEDVDDGMDEILYTRLIVLW